MVHKTSQNTMNTEQHSIGKSIMLHLIPGAAATLFFIITAPILKNDGLPSVLAFLLAAVLVVIPFELGYLFFQAKKRNGCYSLKGIVRYCEKIPVWQYFVFVPALLLWAIIGGIIIAGPIDNYLLKTFFSWLPDWFFLENFINNISQYSRSVLLTILFSGVVLNCIIGPIIEELYFRGYLLPRISRLKGWAPLVNISLFSLYHFFTPWLNPGRIIGLSPMAYAVWWKKNIYLSIWVHCLVNTATMVAMVVFILKKMST